jgi:TPR repeat protein
MTKLDEKWYVELETADAMIKARQFESALIELRRASLNGNPAADYYIGHIYRDSIPSIENAAKFEAHLIKAADAGVSQAARDLGAHFYQKGEFTLASHYNTIAFEAGIASCGFWIYRSAVKMEASLSQQLKLLLSAVAANSVKAINELSRQYFDGPLVKQNYFYGSYYKIKAAFLIIRHSMKDDLDKYN